MDEMCFIITCVNWINKLQEIVEDSEKTSSRFRKDNYNKTALI